MAVSLLIYSKMDDGNGLLISHDDVMGTRNNMYAVT